MGYQNIPMVIQLLMTICHFFICYLLIGPMGVYGPALASTISNLNIFLLMAAYTSRIKDPYIIEAWNVTTKSSISLHGLYDFMKVGLPSVGMICLEWWSFELMAFIAA